MDLIRNRHFKEYVESIVSYCYQTERGLTDAQARAIFKDTFYDDFNMLSFILQSVYPNTRREGDKYLFITEAMIHTDIAAKIKGDVGRMTLEIKGNKGNITYENKEFKSGHIDNGTGIVTCYGDYRHFSSNVTEIGFAGAIMDCYNFARVSKYHTCWGGIKTYA